MNTILPKEHSSVLNDLLDSAGLSDDSISAVELAGKSTNTVYFVTLHSSRQLVLRIYGDSGWSEEYGRARLKKEVYLHELLAGQGVEVPKILTTVDSPDIQAFLAERLPGLPLRTALNSATKEEQDMLWAMVGTSLHAAHQIILSKFAGEIVGDTVIPFESDSGKSPSSVGWGSFAMDEFVDDVDQMSQFIPCLQVDRYMLEEVVSGALQHLDRTPARLLHNDPSVDNVFVQKLEGEWLCSGWIDWEFARHADPAWDCARLDLFRDNAAFAPSQAFWNAYGALDEVNLMANRLLVAMNCAELQFGNISSQRHTPAIEWLTRFPEHISHLNKQLHKQ